MKAVIMAAGMGKRMGALGLDRPKNLIEVAGKTLLAHVLDVLPPEIDEVVVIIGYKGEMIREYLGESYKGHPIRYVEQPMPPQGTAMALLAARPFLDGKFLLLNADDILGAAALAEAIKHPLSILVAEHTEPQKMGVVSVRPDGTMENIIEKPENPPSNLVSTGSMVLDDRLFAYEPVRHPNGEYFMTSQLQLLAKDHPMVVVQQPLWIPVGYPEDIPRAEEILRNIH